MDAIGVRNRGFKGPAWVGYRVLCHWNDYPTPHRQLDHHAIHHDPPQQRGNLDSCLSPTFPSSGSLSPLSSSRTPFFEHAPTTAESAPLRSPHLSLLPTQRHLYLRVTRDEDDDDAQANHAWRTTEGYISSPSPTVVFFSPASPSSALKVLPWQPWSQWPPREPAWAQPWSFHRPPPVPKLATLVPKLAPLVPKLQLGVPFSFWCGVGVFCGVQGTQGGSVVKFQSFGVEESVSSPSCFFEG